MVLFQSFFFDVSGIFGFVSNVGKMLIAVYQSTTFNFGDFHVDLFGIALALLLLDWFFNVIWGVD